MVGVEKKQARYRHFARRHGFLLVIDSIDRSFSCSHHSRSLYSTDHNS